MYRVSKIGVLDTKYQSLAIQTVVIWERKREREREREVGGNWDQVKDSDRETEREMIREGKGGVCVCFQGVCDGACVRQKVCV